MVRSLWKVFLKRLKIKVPYNPAIPLLGIYSEKTIIRKDTCSNVHCSIIYNSQDIESPGCPLTDEWTKKMWYVYTADYYSATKKNGMMPHAATCMDLEITILSEVSQKEKDTAYIQNLKNDTNELNLQNRNRLTDVENKCMVTTGERW